MTSEVPIFYFVHQIKLETIPYIQKEIINFTRYFQDHLDLPYNSMVQISQNKWSDKVQKLLAMMEKKIRQIEHFHYQNWMDYRANLILRSKKLLLIFFQQNKQILTQLKPQHQNNTKLQLQGQQPEQVYDKNKYSPQNNQNFTFERIKQSVKQIKSQINQNLKRPTTNLTQKLQGKNSKQAQKTNNNILKNEIEEEISKIKDKSNLKNKVKSTLVFSSRRIQSKLQKKNNQKSLNQGSKILSNSKNNIYRKIGGSIEKIINNSKQKTLGKAEKVHDQQVKKVIHPKVYKKKEKKEDRPLNVKSNSNLAKGKQMTKQEYIKHLIRKNKPQI